ncbi:MAG: SCO family protein [Acidimicrobiales bacterium]
MAALFALMVVAGIAFAVFQPITVLPRMRLAPGYSLTSADGTRLTSEDARSTLTLYSFAPVDCGEACDELFATLTAVRDQVAADVDLDGTNFRIVTIALDDLDPAEAPAELRDATIRSGADGSEWRWVGGDALEVRTVVGSGFRVWSETGPDGEIAFDPAFVLVDGNGLIRGDYRYQTVSSDDDKLIRHTEILAEEVRNADGPAAVAYEAAHLFLCYP